jgi:hypothetical protein
MSDEKPMGQVWRGPWSGGAAAYGSRGRGAAAYGSRGLCVPVVDAPVRVIDAFVAGLDVGGSGSACQRRGGLPTIGRTAEALP